MREFKEDLDSLTTKLMESSDNHMKKRLQDLKNRLIFLYEANLVKISHSIMELVCASHLMSNGYEVEVERQLTGVLTCDVYATRGNESLIVEVETGFVPPERALEPTAYNKARLASKIARYSHYANKFGLGAPPYYIMQIPSAFVKSSDQRGVDELLEVKSLCDMYYKNPPVSLEEIKGARLHKIYIIDVDKAEVYEATPEDYVNHFNDKINSLIHNS